MKANQLYYLTGVLFMIAFFVVENYVLVILSILSLIIAIIFLIFDNHGENIKMDLDYREKDLKLKMQLEILKSIAEISELLKKKK